MHLKWGGGAGEGQEMGEFQVANFISPKSISNGINFNLFYLLICKVIHQPFQYIFWIAQFMDTGFVCLFFKA